MDNHQKGLRGFIELCLASKDEKTLSALFELFFTAEERADLAMRYLIVKELLSEEKTQREMAKKLSVSIAKITRGSNELKRSSKKIIEYMRKNIVMDRK